MATRKPNGFEFPVPTHASPEKCGGFFSLLPYVTVGDVINDLREPIQKTKDSIIPEDSHYDVTPKRDRERIHGVPEGRNLSSQLHLPIEQRGRLSRKDTTKFLRLCRTKPSNTLRGGEYVCELRACHTVDSLLEISHSDRVCFRMGPGLWQARKCPGLHSRNCGSSV